MKKQSCVNLFFKFVAIQMNIEEECKNHNLLLKDTSRRMLFFLDQRLAEQPYSPLTQQKLPKSLNNCDCDALSKRDQICPSKPRKVMECFPRIQKESAAKLNVSAYRKLKF